MSKQTNSRLVAIIWPVLLGAIGISLSDEVDFQVVVVILIIAMVGVLLSSTYRRRKQPATVRSPEDDPDFASRI